MTGWFGPAALGLALSLLASSPAAALRVEDVPDPRAARGGWVADLPGLLAPATLDTLDAIASALSSRRGAQLAIAIVPETGGQDPRAFATALFRRWGVGRAHADDGVLILVVSGSRRIEVETGYGVEGILPDGRVGAILDRHVIPRFREADWDAGLIAGARAIADVIASAPPDAPLAGAEAPKPDRGQRALPWMLGILAGLGLVIAGRRLLRLCPRCRRPMRILSEREDDAYLSIAERLEETLHSVDHRVWRCDACAILTVEHARVFFSALQDCPMCHRRTLKTDRVTIRRATSTREGLAEVRRRCQNAACSYSDKRHESIPTIDDSSSSSSGWGGSGASGGSGSGSSGGSFGGGSSGGGGAGRSW